MVGKPAIAITGAGLVCPAGSSIEALSDGRCSRPDAGDPGGRSRPDTGCRSGEQTRPGDEALPGAGFRAGQQSRPGGRSGPRPAAEPRAESRPVVAARPGTARRVTSGDDWFDPVRFLGRHGHKFLTPATRYLLAAADLAVADANLDIDRYPADVRGVTVGTNFAVEALVDRFDRLVLAEGPAALSPALAPGFSVNLAASQLSIRYRLHGCNLTLTNPVVAGLESLLVARSILTRSIPVRSIPVRSIPGRSILAQPVAAQPVFARRAGMMFAGATEERDVDGAFDGGACCLVLEALDDRAERAARMRAEVIGGFSVLVPSDRDEHRRSVLVREMRRLPLRERGRIRLVLSGGEHPVRLAVERHLSAILAAMNIDVIHHDAVESSGAGPTVSSLLDVAAVVREPGSGLVAAAGPDGHLAAVLLGCTPRDRE
jgi:hypothetical protein